MQLMGLTVCLEPHLTAAVHVNLEVEDCDRQFKELINVM